MKCLKRLLLLIILTTVTHSVCAQTKKRSSVSDYFGADICLKTMHLWRGIEVSDEISTLADIYFKTKNEVFKAGIWSGVGVNGGFKEFDYYVAFKHSGFEASLWDIYNFSPGASYNNKEAFNYKAKETGRFLDLRLSYRFQESFPLKIFWATLLYGRDRDALNEKNRYSSYLELEYPICSKNGFKLEAGIGGAMPLVKGKDLNGEKTNAHFYGEDPNIVDIHLRLSKTFKFGSYSLPVSLMPMWNPEKEYVNMEVSLQLLSF